MEEEWNLLNDRNEGWNGLSNSSNQELFECVGVKLIDH